MTVFTCPHYRWWHKRTRPLSILDVCSALHLPGACLYLYWEIARLICPLLLLLFLLLSVIRMCFTFGCKWIVSPFQTHFQVGTGSYHLLCPSSEQEMTLGVRESCHCEKVVLFIVSLQHFHQDKRKTLLLLVSTWSLLPDLGTFPTSHPTLLDCLFFQSDQFTSKDWIAIHCILPQFLSSWWVLKQGQIWHVSYSVCDWVCSPL